MPYDVDTYQAQKADGTRLANGAMPLKALKGKHYRVINLHMSGMKGGQIADAMNMTPSWVSTILNDPLVKEEIQKLFVDTDRAMFAKATEVVREKMDDADPAIALRAAEMVWRGSGKFEKKEQARPTAEDVVAKMLEIAARHGTASISVSAGPVPQPPAPPPAFDPFLLSDDTP